MYQVIGQGARHWVVATDRNKVIRIPKTGTGDIELVLSYHEKIVKVLFPKLVPSMQLRVIPRGIAFEANFFPGPNFVESINVMGSYFCVELKPKYIGFENGLYRPDVLFDSLSRSEEIEKLLYSALGHPKKYLRIHSRPNDMTDRMIVELVAKTMMEKDAQICLNRLAKLHQFGADRFCQKALDLMNEKVGECEIYTDMDSFEQGTSSKWLTTFLTGRMAMDVSLMINFDQSLPSTIHIVDTDLKPAGKIPIYYAKFDQ